MVCKTTPRSINHRCVCMSRPGLVRTSCMSVTSGHVSRLGEACEATHTLATQEHLGVCVCLTICVSACACMAVCTRVCAHVCVCVCACACVSRQGDDQGQCLLARAGPHHTKRGWWKERLKLAEWTIVSGSNNDCSMETMSAEPPGGGY